MRTETNTTRGNTADETHPLLANYVERQIEQQEISGSERSSNITFLRWTTCDEIKRCTCAILQFMLMAVVVGSGLVLFWFLWAWFVLYLDLPGVLTPIVWLAGFLFPLCGFKLFQLCPKCTRVCFAQPLTPPDINAWKTHHLWNIRKKFISQIRKSTSLPQSLAEMISDFCFHSDILVTTNKNKLVGIYPDSARLHTVAEFSKDITDLAVANGNIHKVYVLMAREMEKTAVDCRERMGCNGGDDDNDNDANTNTNILNNQNNPNNNPNSTWNSLPSWLWESTEHVDMLICEFDIASGILRETSSNFFFEQISVTTMQQLRGIYYKPSYRLLIDNARDVLVVSRDGDFIVFDNQTLNVIERREIVAHPDNRDDREQFIHLRAYRWNASRIIPPKIVRYIIRVVDQVEGTQSDYLYRESDVYIVIPFDAHALFICNIMSGWLRYLDFSHVDPISDTQIHYVEFSIDNQYLYLCCTHTLSVLSTRSFQPILTVPFTELDYTMPCGLIRTPPTEDQLLLMMSRHRQKLLENVNNQMDETERSHQSDGHFSTPTPMGGGVDGDRDNTLNENGEMDETEETVGGENGDRGLSLSLSPLIERRVPRSEDPKYLEAISCSQNAYKNKLAKKLESISVVFASTRLFMDPRIFLYRFPDNKAKVVSSGNGKNRTVYSGGSFLVDRVTNEAPAQGVGGQWQYISMKQHRPWSTYKTSPKHRRNAMMNTDDGRKNKESVFVPIYRM